MDEQQKKAKFDWDKILRDVLKQASPAKLPEAEGAEFEMEISPEMKEILDNISDVLLYLIWGEPENSLLPLKVVEAKLMLLVLQKKMC